MSCAAGSYGASSGAKIAIATRRTMTTKPMKPALSCHSSSASIAQLLRAALSVLAGNRFVAVMAQASLMRGSIAL